MKVVHLTDTYAPVVGGIERQIERLAALQAAAGHDVTVVSGRYAPGPASRRENGVLVRRPAAPTHRLHALPLHVDDMDADVFHAHLSVVSPGTVRACALLRSVRLPIAATVHSLWPVTTAPVRTLLRCAGLDDPGVAWSAVSGVAAARVRGSLAPGTRVDVVPNAVDVAWWQRRSSSAPPTGDRVVAVVVGRLARRKRVLPFLQALADDWPARLDVVVVGDGPQREAITRLRSHAGLGDRIRVLGGRPPAGVRRILHGADVFVAPSALESFGIAALEARAAGLPVLARHGTGVADFIHDGVDGRFADSDESLADVLRTLTATPHPLVALREHARRRPPSIDQRTAVDAVSRLYERATGRRSAVPTVSGSRARTPELVGLRPRPQ